VVDLAAVPSRSISRSRFGRSAHVGRLRDVLTIYCAEVGFARRRELGRRRDGRRHPLLLVVRMWSKRVVALERAENAA